MRKNPYNFKNKVFEGPVFIVRVPVCEVRVIILKKTPVSCVRFQWRLVISIQHDLRRFMCQGFSAENVKFCCVEVSPH